VSSYKLISVEAIECLVAFHCIALICNYWFLLWLIKYLSIYLSSASEVTTLWRYTNAFIIILLLLLLLSNEPSCRQKSSTVLILYIIRRKSRPWRKIRAVAKNHDTCPKSRYWRRWWFGGIAVGVSCSSQVDRVTTLPSVAVWTDAPVAAVRRLSLLSCILHSRLVVLPRHTT